MCEYLSEPDSSKEIEVEDHGGYLELNAEIKGKLVDFSGYPRISPAAGALTRYVMRLDKNDCLPYMLSSGRSLSGVGGRIELEVTDVKVNAPEALAFDIKSSLPDLPVLRDSSSEIRKYSAENFKENRESGTRCEIPSDTLDVIGGGTYSLKSKKRKVRVVMLTLLHCGACVLSYPEINRLHEKYSASPDVDVAGVLYQDSGEKEAYEGFVNKHGIRFPLAVNNGRFYSAFSRIPMAPIFIVIDRNDRIVLYHNGYDQKLYDIIDGKITECLKDGSAV